MMMDAGDPRLPPRWYFCAQSTMNAQPQHTHSTPSTISCSPNSARRLQPRRIKPCLAALKPMSIKTSPARPGASSSSATSASKKSAGSWAALAKPAVPFDAPAKASAKASSSKAETAQQKQQKHARALRKHLAGDPDAAAKRAQELAAIRASWGGSATKEAGKLGTNAAMKKRRCVGCTRPVEGPSGSLCTSCAGDAAAGSSCHAETKGTLISETIELVEVVSTPVVAIRASCGGSATREAGKLGIYGTMKKRRCVGCTRPVEGPSGSLCARCPRLREGSSRPPTSADVFVLRVASEWTGRRQEPEFDRWHRDTQADAHRRFDSPLTNQIIHAETEGGDKAFPTLVSAGPPGHDRGSSCPASPPFSRSPAVSVRYVPPAAHGRT